MVDREYTCMEWLKEGRDFTSSYRYKHYKSITILIFMVFEFILISLFLYKTAPYKLYMLCNCICASLLLLYIFSTVYKTLSRQVFSAYSKYKKVDFNAFSTSNLQLQLDGVEQTLDVPVLVKQKITDCFLLKQFLSNKNNSYDTVLSLFQHLFNSVDYDEVVKYNIRNFDIYFNLFYTKKESKLVALDIYLKFGSNLPIKLV